MTDWSALLRLVPFALIAAGTWVLTHFMCQRVLRAAQKQADVTTGWFGFIQTTRRVATVCWFAWVGGVLILDPWQTVASDLAWRPLTRLAIHNVLTILPPALIVAAAELMTYPVVQRVRGLDLPRKRFAIDSFLGRLWLTVPAALMWTGFRSNPISKQDSAISMIFMAGGVLALVFCQVFWLRRRMAETFTPHALSVGELRDRAFAMAEKAGVKLSQIFVYPMARWRLANAYASEGNNLLLTDWLLRHLSVREIDSIIAHELAHMKRGHASKQAWLMVLLWLPPLAWLRWRQVMPDLAWVVIWFLGSWHLAGWVQAVVSRRHEREADLDGVAISGDPEAFISALQRVDQLNAMPHELSKIEQSLATHPSTRRRIEALARNANLKLGSIDQPLPVTAGESTGYALPQAVEAATHGDGPLFDSTMKQKIVSRFTGAYLLTVGLPPVALAWIGLQWPDTAIRTVVWVGGVIAYASLIIWVTNRVGRRLQSSLRVKIAERLTRRWGAIHSEAHFVGLSPGAEVRLFEGCYSWDLGFMSMEPGCLRYTGEQTHFNLRREHIRQIRLGPGAPRWRRTQRVYIDWADPERGETGTFALSCPGENSFSADGRAANVLAGSLERWRRQANEDKLNENPELWRLPAFGQVTSTCPRAGLRTQQFVLMLIMVLAVPIGLIGGTDLHRRSLLSTGLAILAVVAGHTFASVPAWRLPVPPHSR